jgi:hypothetical protein
MSKLSMELLLVTGCVDSTLWTAELAALSNLEI